MTFSEFCGDYRTTPGAQSTRYPGPTRRVNEHLILDKEAWTRNYNARKIAEGTHFRAFHWNQSTWCAAVTAGYLREEALPCRMDENDVAAPGRRFELLLLPGVRPYVQGT